LIYKEDGLSIMKDCYLAGDIGGTKMVLALFSLETGPFQPLEVGIFPSREFASLEEIVKVYLSKRKLKIYGASFGVAGPVKDGSAEATNLPWKIDALQLSALIHGASVNLLNDLAAVAHAVPYLTSGDIHTVIQGEEDPQGAIGIVAPGTGLGEAFLVWNGAGYKASPSEGGHVNFGPATQVELELLGYLLARFDHVSYERVCSGQAIPNLYGFFRDYQKMVEPGWLQESLVSSPDPTRVIIQAAVDEKAEICVETLRLFLDILASEAGNLALKVMATGGIYIGGGIPPRILSKIDRERFKTAFTRKGRFSKLLSKIPVHVIVKPDVALFGAACHGFEQLEAA
jgi:glucokinase